MNWLGLLRVGVRGLGLSHQEFWALTPAELAFLLGHGSASGTLTRERLNALAEAFPDGPKED